MINCLIIDNDINTVELIKKLGESVLEATFIETNEDYEKSLNLILTEKLQIVFINIDSPSIRIAEFIFEVTQHILNPVSFIALSKSKEKAYDAYNYEFSDFLLKPLTELSIRKSFLKYKKRNPIEDSELICLKSCKDYQYLNTSEILFLKADNNSTDFYMRNGNIVSAFKTLKTFENILPQSFLRIHKSYIINRKFISRINYSKSICIINGHKVPFTKTFICNVDVINNKLSNNSILALN